jgi:hypothetical protein
MSPVPEQSRHWPFGAENYDSHKLQRAAHAHGDAEGEFGGAGKVHLRHDRLIIGGRAHVKKRGLS